MNHLLGRAKKDSIFYLKKMALLKTTTKNLTTSMQMKQPAVCGGPISTILFDLDNTLIPTRKGDTKACNKIVEILQKQHSLARDAAIQSTQQFLKSFRKCPDNPDVPLDQWRQYLWSEALPDSHQHLTNEIFQCWLELRYRYLAFTPEIVDLLQSLRQNYLLAIITNGPSNAQWEKVQRLNAGKYFDCILVSSDLPWEKPNPHIFMTACNYLGVEPKNCIMIGDKIETDIQGGIEAKLGGTIWIPLSSSNNTITSNTNDISNSSSSSNIPNNITNQSTAAAVTQNNEAVPMHVDDNSSIVYKPDYIINNLQELYQILPTQISTTASSSSSSSSSTNKKNNFRSTKPWSQLRRNGPYNRRMTSLPDLDNGNSNSSDGS